MDRRVRFSRFLPMSVVFGLVLTMALSASLLGQSAEAARRGYGGSPNNPDGRVGTLAITWKWSAGQNCVAYATLAGWEPGSTYAVEYSFNTPFGQRGGSQRITTDANGAAYGWVGAFFREWLVTFSVNGVNVSGYPDC